MTTLLYALTALLPFVAIGAFIQVWRRTAREAVSGNCNRLIQPSRRGAN